MMPVRAADLCSGAGALSYGLNRAGLEIALGVDKDEECDYPFTRNTGGRFVRADVTSLNASMVAESLRGGDARLLAAGAPCQPYSEFNAKRRRDRPAGDVLLSRITELIATVAPEFVLLENVPGVARSASMKRLVGTLRAMRYDVRTGVVDAAAFGVPQRRRRMLLFACRFTSLPANLHGEPESPSRTVRDAIGDLRPLRAGEADPTDPLHRTAGLSELNLRRIRASSPGGTWAAWPTDLQLACHRRGKGTGFKEAYGRMVWDRPAPTITTKFFNYGSGRFGHPEQDRALSAREAARLQGFPDSFAFSAQDAQLSLPSLGRLIGNAVPVPLSEALGRLCLDLATRRDAA